MAQNRYYSSSAAPTTLSGAVGSSGNPSVNSISGLPSSFPYTVLLDWGLATQEAISVTSAPTGTGPYSLPCTRGIDGTTAQAHAQGAVAVHGVTEQDYNEPQIHIATGVSGASYPNVIHGLANTSAVVGTIDTQTLSNKTLASVTITGTATVPTTVNPTDAAQKTYVDSSVANLNAKNSCVVATAVALPANTYANGSSGVGATLTASATGTLTVDGVTTTLGMRILVKNEAAGANNGIYSVTTAGATGVAYVLTRTTDLNTAAQFPGATTDIQQGTANAGHAFMIAASGPFTIGTTAVVWQQQTGGGLLTAGAGITIASNVVSDTNPYTATSIGIIPATGLAETFGRTRATTTSAALTSGTLYLTAIYLPAGITATNLTMGVSGTAKTGGTHGWYVLANSARSVVAVTADKTDAATTWGTTNAFQTVAFNTPYAVTTAGLYYVGVMVAQTAGSMPTFVVSSDPVNIYLNNTAPIIYGSSNTAQTTPPSLATTLTAITATAGYNFYAYIS